MPILGDGNCGFRALAIGLILTKSIDQFSEFFFKEGINALTGSNLKDERLDLFPDFLVYFWKQMFLPMKDMSYN